MQSSPTSSAKEALKEFRAAHRVRTHVIGSDVWDVIESGTGDRVLVLLPGGGGSAESQFPLIAGLEGSSRVLSIGCPASVKTIDSVVTGLQRLLDDYGVSTCYVLGHSLGGIFAEALAITHPERLDGLILANTARYAPQRARMVAAALRSARYLPARAISGFLSSRINRLLRGHPDRDFWLDYFMHDELERVGKEGIVSRAACIEDAVEHWSGIACRYGGPVLILESDNETGFTADEKAALRRAYPDAAVHTFHGAGHLSSITRTAEFTSVVREFIERLRSRVPG